MSKVLVIGNGFDIALGLNTKYRDFANTYTPTVEHAFWPFRDEPKGEFANSSLYHHFYDYFNTHLDGAGNILWIDIENELVKYAKSKIGSTINPNLVIQDEKDFLLLKMMLQKYIERTNYFENKKEPDSNFSKLIAAVRKNGNFDKVYSFNYTDLASELITFMGYQESELPQIYHIHGTPDKEDLHKIVLGINEDLDIPNEYHFLFKVNQTHNYNLAQDLFMADEVIFYGLSFGEIDFPYFNSYFDSVVSQALSEEKRHITICTFGKDGVRGVKESLHSKGFTLQKLKDKSNFNIIDMSNLLLPGYDESAFNNMINRLNQSRQL